MNRFIRSAARCVAVLSLFGGAFAAHAEGTNMIQNGSFELPNEGADGLYGGGGDGWVGSEFGPRIIRGNITDDNGNYYGATPWGQQYLVLACISPTGNLASDTQMVNGFVAGAKYRFTLWAANIDGSPIANLQVKMDDGAGTVYYKHRFKIPTGGPWTTTIGFQKYTFSFMSPVTGALSVTLSNHVYPTSGSNAMVAVDNVSLVQMSDDAPVDAVLVPSMNR